MEMIAPNPDAPPPPVLLHECRKVVFTGDRKWQNPALVVKLIQRLPKSCLVIHGNCRGLDRLSGDIARSLGHQVRVYPADWDGRGFAAGPIRNRQMLDERPDLVIAVHDHLEDSKGTKHCVEEARRRSIPVLHVTSRSIQWVS